MSEAAEVIKIDENKMIREFDIKELTKSNLKLMEKQILEIPEMPEDSKQYNTVRDMNIQAKKILPRIEERRRELKAPVLERGKLIDSTAKNAVSLVEPLIELSGSRRSAWEEKRAEEKAEKERIEKERLNKIANLISDLNRYVVEGKAYNLGSEAIKHCITALQKFDISSVDFQERTEEAEKIRADGLKELSEVYSNRKEFEAEQARQEAEAKRLVEEKAKLEAERKAQEEAAEKKAEEEAEKRRLEEKKLQAERDALEKEKAEIAAKKQAEEDAKQVAIQKEKDHESALIENTEFDRVKAEKLKADEERRELIKPDKEILFQTINSVDNYISDLTCNDLNTEDAGKLFLSFITNMKQEIKRFETAVEGFV